MIVLRSKIFSEKENKKNNYISYIGSGVAGIGGVTALSTLPGINNMKEQARKKFESKFEKEYFDPNSIGKPGRRGYDIVRGKAKGKNIVSARLTLSNENMISPGAGYIENWRKIAEQTWGDKLWQEDNGKRINKDLLTEDNLFDAKNDLDLNFSKEKWAEYKELNDKVLKNKTRDIVNEGSKEELGRFRADKIKALKRLKNLRRVRNIGLATAGIGTGIAIGRKLREKEYSEPITTKDRIKKAGMAGGVFGALGGIAGGIATKSMKGVKVGSILGAGIGSGLSLYGSHKYNKDLKNKTILDQNREQEREREFQENKKLLPVRSYKEFYKQNPRIKKELDDNNLDYFSDYNIPGFKYLKEDGLDITRYLPLTYDSNSTILAVYDLKDKKLKLWDPEVSNELENLGSLKNLY